MHTIQNKQRLVARVRRIRGQLGAVERALEEEKGCDAVLHMVVAARGAMGGLIGELIEDHVRDHVVGERGAKKRARAGEKLIEIVRMYVK